MSPSRHEHLPFLPHEVGGERSPGRRPARTPPHPEVPAPERPADLPSTPRRRATDFVNPLHDALSTLAIGLAVVDPDWSLAYVSEALAELVRRSAAELAGRPLDEVFPTLRGGVESAWIRRTMNEGEPCSFRVEDERSGRVFEVRAARAATGQLVLEVRDATSVARLEQEHERALESIGDALFIVDRDWTVRYWNAAAERLSGRPRDAVIGRDVWRALPGLAGSRLEPALRAAMDERVSGELRHWGADPAAERVFDVRSFPVPGNGILVLVAEVSEELRREHLLAATSTENELLRELAGRLADTPDSATLLAMLCAIVRRECAASGAGVCAVHDETVEMLAACGSGVPAAGFTMPLAGTLTAEVVATRQVQGRRPYSSPYAPLQRLTEDAQVGENMIAPLVAYDQVVGSIVVTRLVGEAPFGEREERLLRLVADHAALALWKSRLLEEAQAANEAKSAFLATMSHELRTPITAITGYGELLTDETVVGELSEVQREMVERMCSVTHQLSALIDELLTYSSLEAGREGVRMEEVGSSDLLRAALAVSEPVARQKGLSVHLLVPPDAPTLRTDPNKVRQILTNLAGNAVKFTDSGAITLSLTTGGDEVRFGVRDTGIGIPERARDRLFQPFTQIESGLTRRYGGSGLGLYISSRLAGLLGGRIEVESRPGEGSLFELVLPG